MILIQVILILFLVVAGTRLLRSRGATRTKAYKKLALLLSVPAAIIFILFPSLATNIAQFVGVGRGADLLLYAVVIILYFVLLNAYIKDRENQRQITELARRVAILDTKLSRKDANK